MAKMVEEELRNNGVDVILKEKVEEIIFPSSLNDAINVSNKVQICKWIEDQQKRNNMQIVYYLE